MILKIHDSDLSHTMVIIEKSSITEDDIRMYLESVTDEHGEQPIAEIIDNGSTMMHLVEIEGEMVLEVIS